jgi:hypothetical protein
MEESVIFYAMSYKSFKLLVSLSRWLGRERTALMGLKKEVSVVLVRKDYHSSVTYTVFYSLHKRLPQLPKSPK